MRTATKQKKTLAMIILNHFFQKLLYHPLSEVRYCIASLLFSKDGTHIHATELGNKVIPADCSHVETALRECLKVTFPDLTLKGRMKTNASSIVLRGITPVGNAKIYIAKQQTLNGNLQTNATGSDCERFQKEIKIVALCQDRESIAKLQMSSACGVPPLYMMEDGNPLLAFLQEKRNKLTQSIIIGILKDIARAVGSCHQKRVLLCNVTPASFIVVAGGQQVTGALQVQVKLSDFFQARLVPPEDERYYSATDCPYETIKSGQLRGDSEEPLSEYFSAPESLQYHHFSTFSDAWTVAAMFYSILLYGGQTYFALRYLPVSSFIGEICSGHRAQRPDSVPLKLWEVIAPNLEHDETKHTSMETVVECLENYRRTLGSDLDKLHEIMSQFSPICEEDIIRDDCLCELVSFRTYPMTKTALHALQHENILPVKEIMHYFPVTTTPVLKFTELGSIPGDFSFPNLARMIGCMKACWNHNPTRRPAFSGILEMINQEIQAVKESEAARLAALPSRVDMQDYDSVYFGSKATEEDSFSHIYDMVLELDPDVPQATGNALDSGDLPQVQLLEGNDLYFSKQDKWGEMVCESEAKRGIDRSPATFKETGWYGNTGINWH